MERLAFENTAEKSWLQCAAIALFTATLGLCGCGAAVRGAASGGRSFRNSRVFYAGRHGPLNKREVLWSQVAWKYFQNNTNADTGLVNGADGQPIATMWDVADSLAALLAARRFKLVEEKEFDERLSRILDSLNVMQLVAGSLPNRYYDTRSRAMVGMNGEATLGAWSALDLGRLMLWLRITRQQFPEFSEYIDRVVLRWNVCQALDGGGNLQGGAVTDAKVLVLVGYPRLGYQQYAASGFESWGFDARDALVFEPSERVKLYGIDLLSDGRDERMTGILSPIVSAPSLLSGLELGWGVAGIRSNPEERDFRQRSANLAHKTFLVQQFRYGRDKIITARTDHRTSQAPFYAIDSIFVKGYPWNTVSEAGDDMQSQALVATQAVFPMRALWRKHYSDVLTENVDHLYLADKGWYEGRFEKTGGFERVISLRTNALVLESLLYQVEGRLYHEETRAGLFELWTKDPYRSRPTCLRKDAQ